MSNYYEPCFYRIDFDVIPSYIELPCSIPVLNNLDKGELISLSSFLM